MLERLAVPVLLETGGLGCQSRLLLLYGGGVFSALVKDAWPLTLTYFILLVCCVHIYSPLKVY